MNYSTTFRTSGILQAQYQCRVKSTLKRNRSLKWAHTQKHVTNTSHVTKKQKKVSVWTSHLFFYFSFMLLSPIWVVGMCTAVLYFWTNSFTWIIQNIPDLYNDLDFPTLTEKVNIYKSMFDSTQCEQKPQNSNCHARHTDNRNVVTLTCS